MTTEEKIHALKNKLRDCDTEEILGIISLSYSTFANADGVIDNNPLNFESSLMSPQKQRLYLVGLLMSTEYSEKISEDDEVINEYKSIENDIQAITSDYIKGFLSFDDKTFEPYNGASKEELKKKIVPMSAFISYFDNGILRYEEQTEELIHTLYDPFNQEIINLTGLSVLDYISFYKFAKVKLYSRYDEANAAKDNIQNFLSGLEEEFKESKTEEEFDAVYKKLLNYGIDYPEDVKQIQKGITGFNKISKYEIYTEFGEKKGEDLLNRFSLKREERVFQYYNQKNPFVEKPLCWINDEEVFLISPVILLSAIYDYITLTIEDDKNTFHTKYTQKKADIVEAEFVKYFRDILGSGAKYHRSVCEIPGSHEHDILVEYKNIIVIAEVKASKVHEPFFNPEKAYTRIERHFFSSNGIGYAYHQAINLKKVLENNKKITLYEDMKTPFEIERLNEKEIIPVVLTLNQFGELAINTSLLLKPEEGQPYPWVCNLHDFQNLLVMMEYLHKDADDFFEYIRWRIKLHDKIAAGDELDIAEFFFTGPKYTNDKDFLYIQNNTKDCLIDKIYFEKYGLIMPDYSQSYVSESLVSKDPFKKPKKIYPNDPCPCRSGKKYKKCHGRLGLTVL